MSMLAVENYNDALRLLSEIEGFAVQNDIQISSLYNIHVAEEVFLPELTMLKTKLAQHERTVIDIQEFGGLFGDLFINMEQHLLDPESNEDNKFVDTIDLFVECTLPYQAQLEKRQSQIEERVWEIETYLAACKHYSAIAEIDTESLVVVTPRMCESIQTETASC